MVTRNTGLTVSPNMIYIIWEGQILEMAANEQISVDELSDVTQHKMDYGSYVGDHVILKNKTYKFNGVVSNIKSYFMRRSERQESDITISGDVKPNQKLVPEYFSLLDKIRKSRKVVTLAFDTQIDGGGIQDCIITSVNYKKSAKHGDAYLVEMTLVQIRKTESATFTQKREQANPDLNENSAEGGLKATQEAEDDVSSSLLLDIFKSTVPDKDEDGGS